MLIVGLLLATLIIIPFVDSTDPRSYSLCPLTLLVVIGNSGVIALNYFNLSTRQRRAFGRNDYLLPENFKTLRRKDIPVTYRLHDDLLRYYRKGTRPVTHPNKIVNVAMSVFLYQIIKLAMKNTISLSGSFELVVGRTWAPPKWRRRRLHDKDLT
ncbi:hypothetical protein Tcan_17146 [Toxocara canis]|uniref:Neurotransmitter-gated ion-channel ligand-binding domain-containing protein n=1 Tax=Toxocara canis TaxID=6265 RepID=A0A0B2VUR4_TOXCA|nr:hypothetical protein Tcan_17146 [Toxocara canis]